MATFYSHLPPINRFLYFANERIREINEEAEQLQNEKAMLEMVIVKFKKEVCARCLGSGSIMALIGGCECDGPRQHVCPECKGKGE